jgi:hypothetical protein
MSSGTVQIGKLKEGGWPTLFSFGFYLRLLHLWVPHPSHPSNKIELLGTPAFFFFA